jgi:hypothetical protein
MFRAAKTLTTATADIALAQPAKKATWMMISEISRGFVFERTVTDATMSILGFGRLCSLNGIEKAPTIPHNQRYQYK